VTAELSFVFIHRPPSSGHPEEISAAYLLTGFGILTASTEKSEGAGLSNREAGKRSGEY